MSGLWSTISSLNPLPYAYCACVRVKRFVWSHKKLTAAAVLGTLVAAGYLTTRKFIREAQEALDEFGKLQKQFEEHQSRQESRHRQFYEDTQKACEKIIVTCRPILSEELNKLFDLTTPYQVMQENRKQKNESFRQAWEDIKISSFSRIISGLYGACLIEILIRVKMNMVARQTCSEPFTVAPFAQNEISRRFLNDVNIPYFQRDGLSKLAAATRQAVTRVIGSEPLNKPISRGALIQYLTEVRKLIENPDGGRSDSASALSQYVVPDNAQLSEHILQNVRGHTIQMQRLEQMQAECDKILKSAKFDVAVTACVDTAFDLFVDLLTSPFETLSVSGVEPNSTAENGAAAGAPPALPPLAKIIPQTTRIYESMFPSQDFDPTSFRCPLGSSLAGLEPVEDLCLGTFSPEGIHADPLEQLKQLGSYPDFRF